MYFQAKILNPGDKGKLCITFENFYENPEHVLQDFKITFKSIVTIPLLK